MEYVEGMVVKSCAGHDAPGYYVVTRVDDGFCYIADGKRRKLAAPKKKNPIHLRATGKTLVVNEVDNDRQLHKLLVAMDGSTD